MPLFEDDKLACLRYDCPTTHKMPQPNRIYSVGTQVVTLKEVVACNGRTQHPRGAVGVVVKSPVDLSHAYRVRFPDGVEDSFLCSELAVLANFKAGGVKEGLDSANDSLYEHVIFQCVVGSQAFGLAGEESDIDRRGFYLPPAELHWSLAGVPEQLENDATQEVYWELQKFLVLALKANPNVLETLYSPLVEKTTPLAEELLDMREIFLSRLVYQTFNGYVMSQFKKMQTDIRNQGQVKWKHVMHLLRLLLAGIGTLTHGVVPIRVDDYRDDLLAVKRGEMTWEQTETWRLELHSQLDAAYEKTHLPERPDYERANAFLVRARRAAV
jgi:predicted nucleotidyltransferase